MSWLHPIYQGKGVGSKLVTALLQEADKRKIPIITATFQHKHQRFYEECGFTLCMGGVWIGSNQAEGGTP